jgi:hypothetical protein
LVVSGLIGLALSAAPVGPLAAGPSAAKVAKPASLNACTLPLAAEVAAAEVTDPCTKVKTVTEPVKRSPLGGTAGSTTYTAHWGKVTEGPNHYLGISVTKLAGSGRALSLLREHWRLGVLGNGALFAAGKGVTASVLMESGACYNPPTEACTSGTLLALKGNFTVLIGFTSAPPTIPGAPEESIAEKEASKKDLVQEKKDEPLLIAIGKTVLKKL